MLIHKMVLRSRPKKKSRKLRSRSTSRKLKMFTRKQAMQLAAAGVGASLLYYLSKNKKKGFEVASQRKKRSRRLSRRKR